MIQYFLWIRKTCSCCDGDICGEGISIGKKLNIQADIISAYIIPDGKYLFYNSLTGDSWDIYWVDAVFIIKLK